MEVMPRRLAHIDQQDFQSDLWARIRELRLEIWPGGHSTIPRAQLEADEERLAQLSEEAKERGGREEEQLYALQQESDVAEMRRIEAQEHEQEQEAERARSAQVKRVATPSAGTATKIGPSGRRCSK